ncbi:Ankyrin repeat-containing protein 15 [Elsinoe fawcettii]|nr:Ankyrin repeat-containing protein 15 [Elsinoe fawcettii]
MASGHDASEFTIGWISALAIEYEAACLCLDEEFGQPDFRHEHDGNSYNLGRIGPHYVVLAFLPRGETGTSSAATVATHLVHAFPNIKFGLLVGVGGGAPIYPERDIRLGDVVVSTPSNGIGGVLQYDFGKAIQGAPYKQTGHLNQPPTVLRTAVTELQRKYNLRGHSIQDDIRRRLAEVKPRMRKIMSSRPFQQDRLAKPDYIHPEGFCPACSGDAEHLLVQRKERKPDEDDEDAIDEDNPAIHYGIIASGNSVIRDATFRDRLATEQGVLCFEMEAAGLMNSFHCLVIRGICDYSDTHKHKDWQGYAAMTASAYATDLIRIIVPTQVEHLPAIAQTLTDVKHIIQQTSAVVDDVWTGERLRSIETWLDAPDAGGIYSRSLAARQSGTCQWILSDPAYNRWAARANGVLALNGESGCGKTVMSATLVDHLQITSGSQTILFYYFSIASNERRTLDGMLRWLLQQMFIGCVENKDILWAHHQKYHGLSRQPTTSELQNILGEILHRTENAVLAIDGIDESLEQSDVLDCLRYLAESSGWTLKILMTGRPRTSVEREVESWNTLGEVAQLDVSAIGVDIQRFVYASIRHNTALQSRSFADETIEHLITSLVDKAQGSFRWVDLQLKAVSQTFDRDGLLATLAELPQTLSETYDRELGLIPDQYKSSITILLMLVLRSEQTMSVDELFDAMAMDVNSESFTIGRRFRLAEDIMRLCPSLIRLIQESTDVKNSSRTCVVLAHASVRDWLLLAPNLTESRAFNYEESQVCILRLCLTAFDLAAVGVRKSKASPVLTSATHRSSPSLVKRFPAQSLLAVRDVNHLQGYDWTATHLGIDDPSIYPSHFFRFALRHWHTYAVTVDRMEDIAPTLMQGFLDRDLGINLLSLMSELIRLPPFHILCYIGMHRTVKSLAPKFRGVNHDSWGSPLRFATVACNEEVFSALLEVEAKSDDKMEAALALELAISKKQEMFHRRGPPRSASWYTRRGIDLEQRAITLIARRVSLIRPGLYAALLRIGRELQWRPLLEALLLYGKYKEEVDLEDDAELVIRGVEAESHTELAHEQVFQYRAADISSDNAQLGSRSAFHLTVGGHHAIGRDRDELHSAIKANSIPWTRLVLGYGNDVNGRIDGAGETPLQLAVRCANIEIISLLLDHGAFVDLRAEEDQAEYTACSGTPLQLAVLHNRKDVVELLLAHGSDSNARWEPPLTDAVEDTFTIDDTEDAVECDGLLKLIRRGYGYRLCGDALQLAAVTGRDEIARVLIHQGAKLALETGTFGTALHAAAAAGHVNMIKILIRAGASIDERGRYFASPLQTAARFDQVATVGVLCDHGADVDATTEGQGSVVCTVIKYGSLASLEHLF